MTIHRVVRDLVTSKRNFWLSSKSLRVVEDAGGNLEVALDPIGANASVTPRVRAYLTGACTP